MARELSEQGISTVIDHHQLKTATSLKELARRSGLKRPLFLPSIPAYQSLTLLLALLSFEGIFQAEPVLPLVAMPAGDLAYISLLAIVWHGLKRSAASGFGALALVLLVSFLNPVGWSLGLIVAAAVFCTGLLLSTTNQARFEAYRSRALKRILYREERQRQLREQEAERKLQEDRIKEKITPDSILEQQRQQQAEDFLDLGPLQTYGSEADSRTTT